MVTLTDVNLTIFNENDFEDDGVRNGKTTLVILKVSGLLSTKSLIALVDRKTLLAFHEYWWLKEDFI